MTPPSFFPALGTLLALVLAPVVAPINLPPLRRGCRVDIAMVPMALPVLAHRPMGTQF